MDPVLWFLETLSEFEFGRPNVFGCKIRRNMSTDGCVCRDHLYPSKKKAGMAVMQLAIWPNYYDCYINNCLTTKFSLLRLNNQACTIGLARM